MSLPITYFSWIANTLAKSLYMPPSKLIGLKSFKYSTPFLFGTRTRKVAFKASMHLPDL